MFHDNAIHFHEAVIHNMDMKYSQYSVDSKQDIDISMLKQSVDFGWTNSWNGKRTKNPIACYIYFQPYELLCWTFSIRKGGKTHTMLKSYDGLTQTEVLEIFIIMYYFK